MAAVAHMDNGVPYIEVFRDESIEHISILDHVSFVRVPSWSAGGEVSSAVDAADALGTELSKTSKSSGAAAIDRY